MNQPTSDYFKVCFKIIEASHLPNSNISSQVSIKIGIEEKRTKIVKYTDRPFYDEYVVFVLNLNFDDLLNTDIKISINQPKRTFRFQKLIGNISMDIATIWSQPDHHLKSWLAVTLPSDMRAQTKGFLHCEINVEASENFEQVTHIVPMFSPKALGGQVARYMVRIYHCVGLDVRNTGAGKDLPDIFLKVSFAGKTGMTTKRQLRRIPEWNEQITFIQLFPPLYQKITVELLIGKHISLQKDFYLPDLTNLSTDGNPPSYGPTYVHFYKDEQDYYASVLMSIETELINMFKNTEKFHGVSMNPIQPLGENEYGPVDTFLCYGILFDAMLKGKTLNKKDIRVSISFGSIGRTSIRDTVNYTATHKIKAKLNNSEFVFLPLHEEKPCVYIRSDWPDTLYRLYNSNLLIKVADELEERTAYAHDLITRGNNDEAKCLLNDSLSNFKKGCKHIQSQFLRGKTKYDLERLKFVSNKLAQLMSQVTTSDNINVLIENSNSCISELNAICEDAQDSLPNLVLTVKRRQNILGYCIIHPRQIIYSKTDLKRGRNSAKISSFLLKSTSKSYVGRVDIWLWLGFWSQVAFCLKELPPGHENISAAVTLPVTLIYTTNQIYSAVCHIYGGDIAGGMDNEGLCDTTVRVLLPLQGTKTITVKRSLAPLWKETLTLTNLQLYPVPEYIQKNPPAFTVELWDQTLKPATLLGFTLITPKVRLHPLSTSLEYSLQWIKLGLNSQILAAFEIIQMTNPDQAAPATRLSQVLPQFLEPPKILYRLEVVFWGIRPVSINQLKGINQAQIILKCGTTEIQSDVMIRTVYPNFLHDLRVSPLELPETILYSPPLIMRLIASSGYIGCEIDKNIHRYIYQLPTRKEWSALSPRLSVVNRAQARHSTSHDSMPDLIPLLEIDPERRHSSLRNRFNFQNRLKPAVTAFKFVFECFYKFLRKTSDEQWDEEDEEEDDWWTKYFSGEVKNYENELETVQEFEGFNDVLKSFIIKQKKSKLQNIATVKLMICLYQWPVHVPVVTAQGQDPETGVLQQSELSDRVKLWIRVYCIRAYNLHPSDRNGKADPYVEIATISQTVSDKSNHKSRQLNPVFGRCLETSATLPIDSLLAVRIMDWDRFTFHDLIGETVIDLENRFYSKHRATCGLASTYSSFTGKDMWRDVERPCEILEKLCNAYNLPLPQYFEKSVVVASKECSILHKTKNNEENQERLALAMLHKWKEIPIVGKALVPEHVETRTLYHRERPGIKQGKLEMWIDMFDLSLGPVPPIVDITPRLPQSYELRVIIWNTAKVPLVDSSLLVGKKHTDIFVKGWLGDEEYTQSTDVHYLSVNGEGNFNWRFIFPFNYIRPEKKMVIYKKNTFEIGRTEYKVPALLHLQVWDSDRLFPNDFIGSMVLELCCIPKGAKTRRTCKVQKNLTPSNSVNLFKVKNIRGWWPFLQTSESKKHAAGYLEAEFQLLTADEATASPAGLGRAEPNALPAPLRAEYKARFLLAPLRILLYLTCGTHKWTILFYLIIVLVVLFVLFAIYSVPIFVVKRLVDD